jgi:hypothetical protein
MKRTGIKEIMSRRFKKFKSIFKKKPNYHKAAPLPPKPEGYRLPWSDYRSPMKIVFVDHDPTRNGMKFAEMVDADAKTFPMIIAEDMYAAMIGNAPQNIVDKFREDFPELEDDADARQFIQDAMEHHNQCFIKQRDPEPDGRHTVELASINWIEMLLVELYCGRTNVEMGFDEDADIAVSRYDLYARGALSKFCGWDRIETTPTAEQRVGPVADIFDLCEGEDRAINEANKRAMRLLMPHYEMGLVEAIEKRSYPGDTHYYDSLAHNLHAVRTWIAAQILDHANMPGKDACMVRVDPTTGRIEVYGNDINKLPDDPKVLGKFVEALQTHQEVIKVGIDENEN